MGAVIGDGAGSADAPVRGLLDRIAALSGSAGPLDLTPAALALAELAADLDYVGGWMRRLGDASGLVSMHAPERGPRLMLAHRLDGRLSAVHDHGTWVAIAAVTGAETHRRYERGAAADVPRLAETAVLGPADVVTMLPPEDVHDHGHVLGSGAPAYVLILTGDDQRRYRRNEWDVASGRHRILQPGDLGRWTADEPWPEG